MNVYFDNAATTMPCPEAVRAVNEALSECWGNPSAAYLSGRRAAEKLRNARESVAAAIGCKAGEVYFTSGGTESDNWAIRAAARLGRHKGRRIITGAAEHDAVRKTCEALAAEGWDVVFLKPDKAGRVSTEAVSKALTDDTALISLMLVNNETGAVNPIAEISELIREKSPSALLHVDAVQGLLKVPFTPKKLGADLVSVSSHKIHGPKGAGALYIREGLRLVGLLTGGGQEGSIRPGTEAMPNIMGFGAAAEAGRLGFRENASRISGIKDLVIELLREKVPGFLINGEPDAPHILNISLPGYRSEVLMNYLDAAGIAVSRSSACKRGARSHVLEAMGLPASVMDGAIRLSFSRYSTEEEARYFTEKLSEAAASLRTARR